ncbi:OmpA family protein [Aureispira anguillae]|uniref:OmpA family protein n=1 Tax=Aureispira anguillae TaxID=2864201 RepID=A0A916DV63_9BACT|nr:OmpA family protein [Aureispira anguillae]BDS13407.1 OmpA family protein [Aureispira anguillae]
MKQFIIGFVAIFIVNITACTYTERIKDGKTAYARKQFQVAIPMLKEEFDKAKDIQVKGETAYMLGESYRRTHQTQAAADWYKRAQTQRYGKDTDLKHARMLQQLQDYDEARRAFQNAGRYAGDVRLYQEEMIACQKAKQWLADSDKNLYQVQSLATNNEATDFSPVLYEAHQLLITSDRAQSEGKENYKWTGEKFFDLYLLDTKAETVERFEAPFNQSFHQGALCFSADKNMVFFTQCGSEEKIAVDYCQIMFSRKNSSGWSAPQAIDLGDNANNYIHPTLSDDGKMLVFACNKAEGFGGYDLYYSIKIGDDDEAKWSEPLNMGNKINSDGNEVFPFLNNDTLYFSSDGHIGMGGLDIFKVTKAAHKWQNPINLEAPINSGGDDFGFIIDFLNPLAPDMVQQGYFSSNRIGGKGSDDIYQFQQQLPPPADTPALVDSPTILLAINLNGLVKEKVFKEKGNPNSGVASYANLMGASIQVNTLDTAFTVGSDVDGTFYLQLDTATDYSFKATKPGYFTQLITLTTKGIVLNEAHPDTTLSVELIMEKIFTNQEIVLENIYYDLDKHFIREDAKPTLNALVTILKRNPTINIQLSSHTDCQGKTSYNEKLSQRRADAAVQYLIQNGINPDRLTSKGYGESSLAINCKCSDCSDEEHQQNRRTTFLVLDEKE